MGPWGTGAEVGGHSQHMRPECLRASKEVAGAGAGGGKVGDDVAWRPIQPAKRLAGLSCWEGWEPPEGSQEG